MKLLLIQPSVGKIHGEKYVKSWTMEPLALSTLAGMTPDDIDIELIDERIDEFQKRADLVGIIETYTAKRAYTIAKKFENRALKSSWEEYASLCRMRFSTVTPCLLVVLRAEFGIKCFQISKTQIETEI